MLIKADNVIGIHKDTGKQIAVAFWKVGSGEIASGFGLVNDRMTLLHDDLYRFEHLVGSVQAVSSVQDGKGVVEVVEDGRSVCRLIVHHESADGQPVAFASVRAA